MYILPDETKSTKRQRGDPSIAVKLNLAAELVLIAFYVKKITFVIFIQPKCSKKINITIIIALCII